ncbi:hypothetical protein PV10_00871 [Exophiala mesophila]|uniref:Uncharacterized protein n=1 Tax=Exophiala mesophila TaxID=212818 RepID=A0A0D1Y8V0_EXOME|nr:uncharacterized protein PV10_00871 [Exophiala mesophila]KIV97076.1 hypothetical protein PV10_00871 [Exophiala mesophila]
MFSTTSLLSLPYEIRHQIWQLVIFRLQPCACLAAPRPQACTVTLLPSRCIQDFKVDEEFDNRILRVCRQICNEVRPMLLESPQVLTVCNAVCLDELLRSVPSKRRGQFRRIRVRLYIGQVKEEDLRGLKGQDLLREAESWCGPFVQMALRNIGVSDIESVDLVGNVEVHEQLRRTVWVDIRLKGPGS